MSIKDNKMTLWYSNCKRNDLTSTSVKPIYGGEERERRGKTKEKEER